MAKLVHRLADDVLKLIGSSTPIPEERIVVYDRYVGRGYGFPTEEGDDAIALLARKEGILLDPVYTGKAMAALLDLLSKGVVNRRDRILFLHTGGSQALFAYNNWLSEILS